jgi:hypothetical protein
MKETLTESIFKVNTSDLQRTTMPTEGDIFELDLTTNRGDTSTPITPPNMHIFTASFGIAPTRIYCSVCRESGPSMVSLLKPSWWQTLWSSWNCCAPQTQAWREVLHSCPRCGEEIERVNCMM